MSGSQKLMNYVIKYIVYSLYFSPGAEKCLFPKLISVEFIYGIIRWSEGVCKKGNINHGKKEKLGWQDELNKSIILGNR